jgi:Ca-activated chloride channel family protein
MKTTRLVLILTLLLLAFPASARADGIIIPEPPICDPCPPPPCLEPGPCPIPSPVSQLAVRYHKVDVTINDQVAVTHVDQVFFNPNDWAVEGTYIFPLPADAAVTSFSLWIDGEPVEGQVLDAEQARQQYQEIVNRMRDPALLEYAGRGAVQAHIFPIPPQGERRVELEYTQALAAENGLVRYVYPLNTEKFSVLPLEKVSISVDVRAGVPIRAVYSPSHNVDISRDGEQHVTAGYEAEDVLPDADFALYYSLGESQAFHLLTYRDPGDETDPGGFFLLLLAPQPDVPERQALAKDVILVLDRSGSMEGDKFSQAQEALRYILNHLNPEDRFNVIAFSTGLESYAGGLRPASEAADALSWVDRLSAAGSTDINRALLEAAAVADRERPTYLIFLTDGLPTEGVTDSQQILDNLSESAPGNLRLFAFGVGYDVDTFLLDSLSQEHHGTSTYVLPGERLDETLSAFYEKISTPVLTDLSLDFGDIAVYDQYPSPLPDLFSGSQIIAVGRYRQPGAADIVLTGSANGRAQTFRFADQVFAEDTRQADATLAALPRLWATRKIGYLLNQVRLKGPDQETIDQIVRLSIRYGIVTPYTSYLVTEPAALGAAQQERIASDQFNQLQAAPPEASSGQAAVEKAAGQSSLEAAEAPAPQEAEAMDVVRIVGARTFVLTEGKWVDTAFDPEKQQTVKVAFALGQAVIAISDGTAYEVVPSEADSQPVNVPPTFTPADPAEATPQASLSITPGVGRPEATSAALAAKSAALPCAGGLLPAALLPLGLLWLQRRREK